MNEAQIRQLVTSMIQADNSASRFQLTPVQSHDHDGINSPQIDSQNIVQSTRAIGEITMAQAQTTYTLKLGQNFNPSIVFFYGAAYHKTGSTIDIRSTVQGMALLGNALYFQPVSTTVVTAGGIQVPIPQSSTSFTTDTSVNPPVTKFVGSQFHIVNVGYPSAASADIVARATITAYNNAYITIYTDNLASGWTIDGSWVII